MVPETTLMPQNRYLIGLFRALIRLYRYVLSPYLGQQCRFYPTCSVYTEQALEKHGLLAGLWLGALRILACRPGSGRQGQDPVPDQFEWRTQFRYKRRDPLISNDETPKE